jgi:hypothetical protein
MAHTLLSDTTTGELLAEKLANLPQLRAIATLNGPLCPTPCAASGCAASAVTGCSDVQHKLCQRFQLLKVISGAVGEAELYLYCRVTSDETSSRSSASSRGSSSSSSKPPCKLLSLRDTIQVSNFCFSMQPHRFLLQALTSAYGHHMAYHPEAIAGREDLNYGELTPRGVARVCLQC